MDYLLLDNSITQLGKVNEYSIRKIFTRFTPRKEATEVRGETKIRAKRSVLVRFMCAYRVKVRFAKNRQFDYVYFFCLGKVGQDWAIGLLVGYVREL